MSPTSMIYKTQPFETTNPVFIPQLFKIQPF